MPKGHQLRVLHTAVSMNPSLGVVKQMEWEQQSADALGLPWKVVLHTPVKIDSEVVHSWEALSSNMLVKYISLRKNFYQWLMGVEQDYDLIILRHSVHDMFEAHTASRLGHKLLTMHHTLECCELQNHGILGPIRGFFEEWLGKAIIKRSLGTVAVTREVLEYEQSREPTAVIKPNFIYPNGVWIQSSDVSDLRTNIPELLFVASYFSEWQGLDLLIDAVEKSNRQFRIHVAGTVSAEDAERCAADSRFLMHGPLGIESLKNLMASAWCGLSSFALERKGMQEACSLKVREYLNAGVPVYAGHKDAGLPEDLDFFKRGAVDIDQILCFAEIMRYVSREKVIQKTSPFISKTILLDRFYQELEHQLAPVTLGIPQSLTNERDAVAAVKPRGLIAVTGASGFIGRQLVPGLLADGWKVRVLTRQPQKWSTYESIEVCSGDLLTTSDWNSFVAGADVILHAAAEIRNPSLMVAVNVDAPKKLFQAALLAGVKRWVQLSSVGAYGAKATGWVNEETSENPVGPYEESKTFFDAYLRNAANNRGMQICIVRPSNVYGPKMANQSLFQMVRMVGKGLFAYIGPTGASANYVHVDDVVSALVLCTSSPAAAGQTYNVSDWTTLENMVRSMSASLKMSPPSVRLPLWFAMSTARLLQWVPRWPLTLGRVQALNSRVRYATTKIEQELGWSVSKPVVHGVSELAFNGRSRAAPHRLYKTGGGVGRLLIVSYDWPPRNSIATHRPYSWARHWAAQGIDVTVLTASKKFFDLPLDLSLPEIEGVTVVEANYNTVIAMSNAAQKRMSPLLIDFLKIVKNAMSYVLGREFDIRTNWADVAKRMIAELGTDFDAVVSTYGPDSAHKIAAKFKQVNPDLFWVADYRDLWSLNARNRYPRFLRAITSRKELEVVRSADLFTTVSHELAELLQQLVQKQPSVIYNGFDIELDPLRYKKPLQVKGGCLRVLYTGRIYSGKRNPAVLVRALESLIDSGRVALGEVSLEFYGVNTNLIYGEIGRMKYPELVKQLGYVPRDQVLKLQESADLLLLLESGDEDSKGFLTGKIFEYIAAGRPILSIGSAADSAIARVLNETRCGRCYVEDSDAISEDLFNCLRGQLPIWFDPDLQAIQRYSRKYQADLLLQTIKTERLNVAFPRQVV
jgi:nucleoside-diphosphate-sugar epimerase/glycosyltransferase involved in cell wall biosynthesis